MKKTNLLITLYTSLIASFLVSTASVAAIPTMELLKAEPVERISLKHAAETNLMQSFKIIEINSDFVKNEAKAAFAIQKEQAKKNRPVIVTKVSLIAD